MSPESRPAPTSAVRRRSSSGARRGTPLLASLHRIEAIARHNVVLRLRDPGQVITYLALPMILMLVLAPLYESAVDGGVTAVVTGMIILFSVFVVGVAGNAVLNERQWRTWDRLRQTRATPLEMALGKLLPLYLIMGAQQAVLVVYGCAVIGAPWPRSPGLLVLTVAVWSFALLALGTALATVARSLGELSAVKDVGAMVLGSMAGALVPLALMPAWAQAAAHASPGFYALRMLQASFTGDSDTVLVDTTVLVVLGGLLITLAVRRLARGWGRATLL
ncbi:MAG: ABC transporter permease [Kineosporiaceae bacterium]